MSSLSIVARRTSSSTTSIIRSSTCLRNMSTTNSVSPSPYLRSFNRFNSTSSPTAVEDKLPVDPKITSIVDSISKLTLLETSQLIKELKTTLNIPDITFASPSSSSLQSGTGATGGDTGAGSNGDAAGAAATEEEEVQSIFTVKLESFDTKSKAKIIKEVKNLLSLSLVEAKKFVESSPKVLKENVGKEDADKIKATLEGLGAKVSLE
ncbi:mitochondrial 54S ribosomal protein bL12m NDAI_0I01080 [Naumovozyma dairenensis CBS 421]|uniref:Ribosomal protein L7/L12 C-terminal domain-containing protein n=1 Tax=Naumovozyma dairenensis (strain ATCC 10597 / BCRC 20456 / CBS 421 / NBRC 0211 / NRRL Y-12639) TaxID=1071378 RepID=G0WFW6_NAUDC|nr:hypothetical protein NDAI_0I01080 [Naumovozyma dairenensis CBS 421]CCD26677.1 hypothetical protein NDAI_0I01080 [Naumovozyma dairenensis CBS 421]